MSIIILNNNKNNSSLPICKAVVAIVPAFHLLPCRQLHLLPAVFWVMLHEPAMAGPLNVRKLLVGDLSCLLARLNESY